MGTGGSRCSSTSDGKIRAPCMIRGVSAAKRAPSWQDLRAMHSRKAICGAFRMHGARILPKPARFGRTAAICCQGGALSPSEAPSGIHEARKLPRQGVRERIAVASCQQSRTSSRERVQDARFCHVSPEPIRGMRRCPAAAMRAAAMEESGRGGIGARSAGAGVGSGISPFRSLIARNGFESALFRWASMSPLRVLRSCAVSWAEAKSALTFI